MRPLIAALAFLLLLPAGAAAQDDPVLPAGARAGGMELGGQTVSQAAATLDAAFSAVLAQPLEIRVAGHRRKLVPATIDFAFDPLRSAKRAYNAAIAAGGPADVPLHVTYDGDKLAAFTVALDKASDVRPRSARLKMTIRRMKVRRARMGWSIDEKALALSLDPLLADPWASRIVRVERVRVHPKRNLIDLRRAHRAVLTIDRASFKLRYFKNLKLKRSYGIAVGAPGFETPTGRFSIHNKAVNPAWSAPDEPWAGAYRNEVVEGGSPENPLKARWMGIVGGVGIHGTAAEYSIGTAASHGCIRMRVADVIDLYPRVPLGTTVLIR
jgi:L,D-transpeptidase catalytic domain/Putative peptidoglycan binding domain